MNKISEESFNQMIALMEKLLPLSLKLKRRLKSILHEIQYGKGARILNCRERQTTVWLMINGLAKEAYTNPNTYKEKTNWFWFKNNFIYTTPGFFDQQPSESAIELLTDCKLVLISYDDFSKLKKEFPEAEKLSEMIRSAYEKTRRAHAEDIKSLTTTKRYLKHRPVILELLKVAMQKDVAEYLGMSSDTLGRLRKRL